MTKRRSRRHRLPARQDQKRQLVDPDLGLIDRLVIGDDLVGERFVALDQRLHGAADLLLGAPAHGEQPIAQIAQLAIELAARVSLFHPRSYPNFPVT